MKPTLGFIGLGMMGAPMAMRLIDAGFTVHIHNRTKERSAPLTAKGAVWKESPADLAAGTDIVITMVTNDDALKSLSEQIQPTLRTGGLHIDCSTVSPLLTSMLETEYDGLEKGFLHSPVLGSTPQATDGSLLLFVGGSDRSFAAAETVLRVLGSKIWRFPSAAQATNMKLIMNSFIGGMIATLSQALHYGEQTSIDGSTILNVLQHSALNAPMYQTKGKSLLEKNFAPRFFLENLLKDTDLFRSSAEAVNAASPIADRVSEMLKRAVSEGYAKEDYSAIIKVFRNPR